MEEELSSELLLAAEDVVSSGTFDTIILQGVCESTLYPLGKEKLIFTLCSPIERLVRSILGLRSALLILERPLSNPLTPTVIFSGLST